MRQAMGRQFGAMVFGLGFLSWFPISAYAQASNNGMVPLGRNTPQQVLSGAATVVGHYDPNQALRLVVGLRPPKMSEEEQFLRDVQDRSSPQFHHFLTAAEWNARFGPTVQDEQTVVDWAKSQGLTVTNRYSHRLVVDLVAPVASVERAFGVTINTYQLRTSTFFSNDREPLIPQALTGIVESVGGMNSLQVMHPAIRHFKGGNPGPVFAPGPVAATGSVLQVNGEAAKKPGAPAKGVKPAITNGYYDPSDIWASTAYDYQALQNLGHCCNPGGASGGSPVNSSIAIATAYAYQASDLLSFAGQYNLALYVSPISIDGTAVFDPNNSDETTLDVEYASAMANSQGSYLNTAHVYAYQGANAYLSTFTDIYSQILSDSSTRVFTTSWGCAEYSCTDSGTMSTDHNIFDSMAGQGWTMLAASDDRGSTADCATTSVEYPASDPDIVAAGGTTLFTGPGGYGSETGWQGGTFSGACGDNDGGSGGGCSQYFGQPGFQANSLCGNSRNVPDMALNASVGENYFFNGSLSGAGGTSIVAPELAGFFAQANSYLLYLNLYFIGPDSCYGSGTGACGPIGAANTILYFLAENPTYEAHYPFYDITSGCNSNDITLEYGLTYYCAGTGYDLVTGWGSANMLQLAWGINTYIAGDFGAPAVTFTGPGTNKWFNTDQTVSLSIADTAENGHPANGVSGFTAAWDQTISDPSSEPTPGSGNSFYSGPANPNATSGSTDVASQGQGCHTLYVDAWDNAGFSSGNQAYGPVCYDDTPPVTTASISGTTAPGGYLSPVKITLSASDAYSGVAKTLYEVDSSGYRTYTGPFQVTALGSHTVYFYSVDVAGNTEATESVSFTIVQPSGGGGSALQFIPVTPCRIADTRNANGPFGGPELGAKSTRSFTIPSSSCGIPKTALAFSINATVVPSKTLQYLTIWPAGQAQPNVSTLNSYDGRVKANAAIVPGSSSGAISVYASDATNVILDIDGYFVAKGTSSALAFYTLAPCRIVDTRGAKGSLGGPSLGANSTRAFPLQLSSCGIPSNATAYSLNYTALPHATLGYLTTWPTGKSQPDVSTLNAPTGAVTANAAIVPAGSSGDVSVYVTDATDLLIDIDGYYAPPAASGLSLYTLTPCRVIDTRNSGGSFSGTLAVKVETSSCAVPSAARAYVFNATVIPPAALDYLSLWANGQAQPNVSTLNAYDAAVTSNMAIVPTTNGMVDAFASNKTQMLLDISSYFAK